MAFDRNDPSTWTIDNLNQGAADFFGANQEYKGALLELEKSKVSTSKSIASTGNKSAEKIASSGNKSAEKIASGNQATQKYLGDLQSSTQLTLQDKQDAAELARLTAQIQAQYNIQDKDLAHKMAVAILQAGVQEKEIESKLTIARNQLGHDKDKLAAEVSMHKDNLALARDQMVQIGIPKMLADKWYQEQQVSLARSAQKIEMAKVNIQRGELGLEAFNKGVELASSPAKYFQFGDFATGLNQNAQANDWLKGFGTEVAASGFGPSTDPAASGGAAISPQQATGSMLAFLGANNGGTAAGLPAALTLEQRARRDAILARHNQLLAAGLPGIIDNGGPDQAEWDMLQAIYENETAHVLARQAAAGGTGGTAGTAATGADGNTALAKFQAQQAAELAAIQGIAGKGGSSLMPGSLEAMAANDPDSLAKFQSGLAKLRYSVPDWMRSYQRAGVFNAAPEVYLVHPMLRGNAHAVNSDWFPYLEVDDETYVIAAGIGEYGVPHARPLAAYGASLPCGCLRFVHAIDERDVTRS